jgi:hypothetical protein
MDVCNKGRDAKRFREILEESKPSEGNENASSRRRWGITERIIIDVNVL